MSGIEGAISAVDSAITAAKKAEIASNQTGVIISSRTLEILADCMKALEKVYPNLELCVQAAQKLEDNPDADIPAIGDISGSSNGDADAAEIVALAAWDRWVLESDQQLEFAVNSNIRGASLYRLALRKHAVNGKQLAQAQAEAIKAGQQYIHAVMDVILSEQDIEALKALRKSFDGLGEVYDQARAKFFDRFLAMRTSLVVEMRNMIWAFRYWALEDSKVVLDSQKLAADFQADLYYITREVETANESYSTDFQRESSPCAYLS